MPLKRSKTQVPYARSRQGDAAKLTPNAKFGSSAEFEENNNYVSMEVSGPISEQYPSDAEDGEVLEANTASEQNSQSSQQSTGSRSFDRKARSQTPAKRGVQTPTESEGATSQSDGYSSSESESSDQDPSEARPGTSKESTNVEETLDLMQRFMIEKGLIDRPMSGDQMKKFIEQDVRPKTASSN